MIIMTCGTSSLRGPCSVHFWLAAILDKYIGIIIIILNNNYNLYLAFIVSPFILQFFMTLDDGVAHKKRSNIQIF